MTDTGTPASNATDATPTPVPAGFIKVYAVDQVPEDATVLERDDPRIRGVEPLQSALDDALENYGRVNRSTLASVRVEGEDLARVREALNATPSHHDLPGHAPRVGGPVRPDGRHGVRGAALGPGLIRHR